MGSTMMTPAAAAPRGRELRGRDVLLGLIGFFLIVFAVNGYFLYSALSTHTGVVANEPYRKGLAYNDRIAADERQARLGWTGDLEAERSGRISLSLSDRDGRAVTGQAVTVSIGRPVTGKDDTALALKETAPGLYVAAGAALAPGAWIVSADVADHANAANPSYRLRRRVWLKP